MNSQGKFVLPPIESLPPALLQAVEAMPMTVHLLEIVDDQIFHAYGNAASEAILGRPDVSARGRSLRQLGVSGEQVNFWAARFRDAKKHGQAIQFCQYLELGNWKAWSRATAVYLSSSANGRDLCMISLDDVSEKVELSKTLRDERERFRLAIEGANAGLWDWHVPSGKVFYSRKWKQMLGYTEEEVPNLISSWENLLHPDDRERSLATIKQYFEFEAEEYHLEHRLRAKDGQYRWMLAKGACRRGSSGKPLRFIGWNIDIHELRSTVEELKNRDRIIQEQQVKIIASAKMSSLGEMAGSIAHEINNPLAIIALSATQISDAFGHEPLDQSLIRESLQRIDATVKRIGKIVKGLRAFSRSGENDPFSPSSAVQIVNDTLALCRARFKSTGIELRIGYLPEGPIACRAVQISQVLLNLLNNALDAVRDEPNPWVEVKVEERVEGLRFSVTNGGKAIPAEVSARMMEPFFTTKEVGEGTGLGLSIAKGIIEDHGGNLVYDPSCPHTRFFFDIAYRRGSC